MTEMNDTDPADEPEVTSIEERQAEHRRRETDGVSSLRDVEAEEGDDEGLADTFDLDDRGARELGAGLDGRDEPEPRLD
jgi:hypothetical protein